MIKTTLGIEGMACGMCEAHINDVVRRNFRVKSVKSSFSKGKTEILSEEAPDEAKLRAVINDTGYAITSFSAKPFEKKHLSLFKK